MVCKENMAAIQFVAATFELSRLRCRHLIKNMENIAYVTFHTSTHSTHATQQFLWPWHLDFSYRLLSEFWINFVTDFGTSKSTRYSFFYGGGHDTVFLAAKAGNFWINFVTVSGTSKSKGSASRGECWEGAPLTRVSQWQWNWVITLWRHAWPTYAGRSPGGSLQHLSFFTSARSSKFRTGHYWVVGLK